MKWLVRFKIKENFGNIFEQFVAAEINDSEKSAIEKKSKYQKPEYWEVALQGNWGLISEKVVEILENMKGKPVKHFLWPNRLSKRLN